MSLSMNGDKSKTENFRKDALKKNKEILEQIAVPTTFDVPIPRPPNCPLLYVHKDVSTLFDAFQSGEVLNADLDAMGSGVIEAVPLVYHGVRPWDMDAMRQHVHDLDADKAHEAQEDLRLGRARRVVPDALADNPLLDAADFKLVDIDFEDAPLEQRTMPSLSLLQNPLYTELGQETPDARAARRGDSYVQAHLARPSAALDNSGGSPADLNLTALNTNMQSGGDQAINKWAKETNMTFKNVNALDSQFATFLDRVGGEVLFLSASEATGEHSAEIAGSIQKLARVLLRIIADAPERRVAEVLVAVRVHASEFAAAKVAPDAIFDNENDDAVATSVRRWLSSYNKLLPACFDAAALEKAGKKAPQWSQMLKASTSAATSRNAISLTHPGGASDSAYPLAVLPMFPTDDVQNYNAHDDPVSVLQFRGAKRRTLGEDTQPSLLVDNDTLMMHDDREGDNDDEATGTYNTETTGFVSYKEDRNHHGHYVLVVRDEDVVYRRIPRLSEYHRSVQTTETRQLGSGGNNAVVIWEDEANNKKRPRTEGTVSALY